MLYPIINRNNNMNDKKKLVLNAETIKKLKEKIKEIIRKKLKESSTSASVGGFSTPFAFGKIKNPTGGLPGYNVSDKKKTNVVNPDKK